MHILGVVVAIAFQPVIAMIQMSFPALNAQEVLRRGQSSVALWCHWVSFAFGILSGAMLGVFKERATIKQLHFSVSHHLPIESYKHLHQKTIIYPKQPRNYFMSRYTRLILVTWGIIKSTGRHQSKATYVTWRWFEGSCCFETSQCW